MAYGEVAVLIAVDRVTHDGPLDAGVFDAPVLPLEPELEVDAVLSSARRAEEQAEVLRAPCAYTRTSKGRTIDAGNVRQDDSQTTGVRS